MSERFEESLVGKSRCKKEVILSFFIFLCIVGTLLFSPGLIRELDEDQVLSYDLKMFILIALMAFTYLAIPSIGIYYGWRAFRGKHYRISSMIATGLNASIIAIALGAVVIILIN